MWKLGDRKLYFCFGNNEASHFISGNTFLEQDIYIGFSPALHVQCILIVYLLFLKLFYQLIPEATPKNLGVGALNLADSLHKGE
jgi:hypothetical protein